MILERLNYRGTIASQIAVVFGFIKLIVGLSHMVTHHPQIKELDINPLFVHEEGRGATLADIIITFEE